MARMSNLHNKGGGCIEILKRWITCLLVRLLFSQYRHINKAKTNVRPLQNVFFALASNYFSLQHGSAMPASCKIVAIHLHKNTTHSGHYCDLTLTNGRSKDSKPTKLKAHIDVFWFK